MARFFEYSRPSTVFLIAATVWDSRGVLAFGATICDYGKLLFQGMNYRFRSYTAAAAILLVSLGLTPALPAKTDLDNICVSVGRLLEEGHYTHKQLNDDMSGKILRSYLELLDYTHLFVTQEVIDAIAQKYGNALEY